MTTLTRRISRFVNVPIPFAVDDLEQAKTIGIVIFLFAPRRPLVVRLIPPRPKNQPPASRAAKLHLGSPWENLLTQ